MQRAKGTETRVLVASTLTGQCLTGSAAGPPAQTMHRLSYQERALPGTPALQPEA